MSRKQLIAILAGIVLIAGLLVLFMMKTSPSEPVKVVRPPAPEVAIGTILPLSGDMRSLGEQIRDGHQIAIEELNARPNAKYRYRLVAKDSKADKTLSEEKIKELKKEGVSFLAELFGTGPTLHCMKALEENKLILVSGITTGAQLSAKGGAHFFRIIPSDRVGVEQLVRWALELELKRAAVIYLKDAWGTGLREAFAEEFAAHQGTVALEIGTVEKQQSFTKVAAEIKKANPDVVMLFIDPTEAGLVLTECSRLGLSTRFMGVDTLIGSEIRITGGVAIEGVMYVVPYPRASSKGEQLGKLFAAYRRRLGYAPSDPPLYSVMGYDTVHVLARAIEAAGPEVEPVTRALEALKYDGASGRIEFAKNHDLKVVRPHVRYKYVKEEDRIEAREVPAEKTP